jgi:hypothetical protein
VKVEIKDVSRLAIIYGKRFGGMEHHAFRIFGLDTSFTRDEEIQMAETPCASHLYPPSVRLATGTSSRAVTEESKVTVRLADILPLLVEATQKNRAWLKDFRDDDVTISQDLYEVTLAYRSMGRAA